MSLIGLRHKTQWWEANLRVVWFWVPNTFLRPYLDSKPISPDLRSKGPSSRGRIYMVPRPLQKLSGNSPPPPPVHNNWCLWGIPNVLWQLVNGLGLDFSFLEWCFDSLQYIVHSFMLRYFEKFLCYISIILVILSMKMNFQDSNGNS